jgi:succinate dehydrogenase / fumarate reductase flavoprotein subunit
MEFVQFHPTTLCGTNILITEGVRGEGGVLVNAEGERFMDRYAPEVMELAPRDIVARAIQTEAREGRAFADPNGGPYVHLDVRHLGADLIKTRLPGIRQIAIDFAGVDPIDAPIPVQPGQHYSMGGLACDENGVTSIPGLFAVGECSCISVHGANRLGGNSLLETVVFGQRAGMRAAQVAADADLPYETALETALQEQATVIAELKGRVEGERQIVLRGRMTEVMTERVGIFREEAALAAAVEELADLKERYRRVMLDDKGDAFNYDLVDTLELGGMLDLAEVTARTALRRTECRGSHWRTDHPGRDDESWLRHSMAYADPDGPPRLEYEDVIITKYPPQERKY